MKYPPNTLALPYKCGDPDCACGKTFTEMPYRGDLVAHPSETPSGWQVDISSDYGIIDHFTTHADLNDALDQVHRAYPDAEFDPEAV